MELKYILFRWMLDGMDLLFPPTCGGCNCPGYKICPDCLKQFHMLGDTVCQVCGHPLSKSTFCLDCKTNRPPYKSMRSWVVYDGPIRNILLKLKYLKNFSLGDELAHQVAGEIKKYQWPIDCIVPIPLGKKRLRERGYNQVGMIAFSLAVKAQWEYLPGALERVRETNSQVGLTARERKENVRDAFRFRTGKIEGKTVLLLDDIATTGATIHEGTKALLAGGAREVYAFTIARAAAQNHPTS